MADSILKPPRRQSSRARAAERVRDRHAGKDALLARARAAREASERSSRSEDEAVIRQAATQLAEARVAEGKKKTAATREVLDEVKAEGRELGFKVSELRAIVQEVVVEALNNFIAPEPEPEPAPEVGYESEEEEPPRRPARRSTRSATPPRRSRRRDVTPPRRSRRSRRYDYESESEESDESPEPRPRRSKQKSRRKKKQVSESEEDTDGDDAASAGVAKEPDIMIDQAVLARQERDAYFTSMILGR